MSQTHLIPLFIGAYIPSAIMVFLYTYSSYKLVNEMHDEAIYKRNQAGHLTWVDHMWFFGNILFPGWNTLVALLILGAEASDHFARWMERYLQEREQRKLIEKTKDEFVP